MLTVAPCWQWASNLPHVDSGQNDLPNVDNCQHWAKSCPICRLSLAWGKSFLPNVENIIILAQCWQFFSFSMFFLFLNSLSKSSLEDCGSSPPSMCVCVWYMCVCGPTTLCVCVLVCVCVCNCVCPALSKSSLEECGSTTLRVCVCMCVCACVTLYLSLVWKTVAPPHSVCVIVICVCVCVWVCPALTAY